jgi:hypothetical protein
MLWWQAPDVNALYQQLSTMIRQFSHTQSDGAVTQGQNEVSTSPPTLAHHAMQSSGPSSLPSPGTPAVVTAMQGSLPERSLRLGNGQVLEFTLESIPDPPAISFAGDIPRLNGMWDDQTAHWSGTSPLVVNGQPIAVVHWPELYKYGKKDQWKGMKARWFEWKV